MSKFQVVPDQTDLEKMVRDLQFYPSRVTDPSTLSRDQVANYNRDGYVKNLAVFSPTEADEIRAYFDELLERAIAAGGDSYSISSAHLTYGRVYDLLREPRILAIVKDILGNDVIGWGSHFFCKMPHDGKSVAWHQDASYWPLTPSKAVTVWLAIDDADAENACMKFVAGSQSVGHLTYRPSADGEGNVLNQTIDNAEQYGEVVFNELSAGRISLHSDLLLHGSEANNSDRRRCGLTLRYCTPDVSAGSNWHDKGVLVAGEDYSGNWKNPTRPKSD